MKKLLWAVIPVALTVNVGAATLPEADKQQHLGVASCATGMCHGKVTKDEKSHVWLNEYRLWSKEDRHSKAFQTLRSAASKRIAENLGVGNATTAKICLDCHADNVATVSRGPKFQLSDGVGCEACHGGSEKWIRSHAEAGASHQANLASGMYPTEDPSARAELCLSCHVGTKDKFASHRIMGAGHPRLSFDLETFTANQPAHYNVDDDYRQRKGEITSMTMWVTGLGRTAQRWLDVLVEGVHGGPGLFPELALYDCHSCHHGINDQRWAPIALEGPTAPGAVRINDANLQILHAVLGVIDKSLADELKAGMLGLHQGTAQSASAQRAAAVKLSAWLGEHSSVWASHRFSVGEQVSIRLALLAAAAGGQYRDFTSAELAFMGVETISISLGDYPKKESALDALYEVLKKEDQFKPSAFATLARTHLGAFK